MTTFRKKMFWPFDPDPGVKGVSVGKIFATTLLYVSFPLIWYTHDHIPNMF